VATAPWRQRRGDSAVATKIPPEVDCVNWGSESADPLLWGASADSESEKINPACAPANRVYWQRTL